MNYLEKPSVVGVIFASFTASLLGYAWYNKQNLKILEHRSKHLIKCRSKPIEKQKIILAIDLQNLFINFSDVRKQGYKLLKQKSNGLPSLMFKGFRKHEHCYREKISGKSIRQFMKRICEIPNIEVVLYTRIEQQYCNQILQNIGIQHLFPHQKKYFTKNRLKSAEEIDCDTGRVIILTANPEDQKDEIMSSHHNLILSLENEEMDENLLFRLQQYFQKLAQMGRTDSLHEQMYHLGLQMRLPLYNYQSMIF